MSSKELWGILRSCCGRGELPAQGILTVSHRHSNTALWNLELKSSWITVSVRKKQSWFGHEGEVHGQTTWSTGQGRIHVSSVQSLHRLCCQAPAGPAAAGLQLGGFGSRSSFGKVQFETNCTKVQFEAPLWNQSIFTLCISFFPMKVNHFSFLSSGHYWGTSGALSIKAVADWGNQAWRG